MLYIDLITGIKPEFLLWFFCGGGGGDIVSYKGIILRFTFTYMPYICNRFLSLLKFLIHVCCELYRVYNIICDAVSKWIYSNI